MARTFIRLNRNDLVATDRLLSRLVHDAAVTLAVFRTLAVAWRRV
jgi:hypothetical protein